MKNAGNSSKSRENSARRPSRSRIFSKIPDGFRRHKKTMTKRGPYSIFSRSLFSTARVCLFQVVLKMRAVAFKSLKRYNTVIHQQIMSCV